MPIRSHRETKDATAEARRQDVAGGGAKDFVMAAILSDLVNFTFWQQNSQANRVKQIY